MALETFNPPVAPSPGTQRRPELTILSAQFGDGFSQDAADGLNYIRKTIEVRWDVLTQSQAKTITDFFEAKGGITPFLYRHPFTPAALKFTCKDWSLNDNANGLCSLNATFKQTFNLVT